MNAENLLGDRVPSLFGEMKLNLAAVVADLVSLFLSAVIDIFPASRHLVTAAMI